MVRLSQQFALNLNDDVRQGVFPAATLGALPADWLTAHPPDAEGMITVTTNYPDLNPLLA